MSTGLSGNDSAVWNRLVESHNAFAMASREFLSPAVNHVRLIQNALRGEDRIIAICMLHSLKTSELQQLFGDLVFLASFSHGAIETVRSAILSLPQEWVLAHMEQVVEPLLRDGTYDEYRRLLELYTLLDRNLALELARRAAEHTDEGVREVGRDFLGRLGLNPRAFRG
jgi:hypothetical protein